MTKSTLFVNSILALLYAFFGLVGVAHAYLDAGTGSFVLQMLVAAILGGLLYIKLAWHNVKAFFQRLFSRSPKQQTESEDPSSEEL